MPEVFNVAHMALSPWDNDVDRERPAVYFNEEVWTYGNVLDEVKRVSNALRELKLEKENRLLMLVYDSPQFVSLFFGAIWSGVIPVPINTYLKPEEILYYLEDSGAKGVALEEEIWRDLEPTLRRGKPKRLREVIVVRGRAESQPSLDVHSYDELVKGQGTLSEPEPASRDEMAFWLYTSGTTGFPRAAVHLHKDMLVTTENYAKGILGMGRHDRVYSASKLFFAYGLGNGGYFPLLTGGSTILYPGKVSGEKALEVIHKYKPSIFFGVPTLYLAMLNVKDWEKYDLGSLKFCVSAGEPLPSTIYRMWKERYNLEILDGIGSTEALHIYVTNRPGNSKPGVTGQAVPGYQVKLIDEEGREVNRGMGELYVKGDSFSPFYWNRYKATREHMIGEWFRTGDMFMRNEEGDLVYLGRTDDMFKSSGMWVSPKEVEDILLKNPRVLEVAVVGVPDEVGLTRVVAFVVPKNDPKGLVEELVEMCRKTTHSYKCPKEVRIVNELPKTATGKIRRYLLRKELMVKMEEANRLR